MLNTLHLFILSIICHPGLKLRQQKEPQEPPLTLEEDREEEISGAQFLCETVMRSLTLEEAPDHRPLRRSQRSGRKPQGENRWPFPAKLHSFQGG